MIVTGSLVMWKSVLGKECHVTIALSSSIQQIVMVPVTLTKYGHIWCQFSEQQKWSKKAHIRAFVSLLTGHKFRIIKQIKLPQNPHYRQYQRCTALPQNSHHLTRSTSSQQISEKTMTTDIIHAETYPQNTKSNTNPSPCRNSTTK